MASSKPVLVSLFLILLLIGYCAATRPGITVMLEGGLVEVSDHSRPMNGEGYFHQGFLFSTLPKGVIAPSSPSKWHNEVVDSSPKN
ncbi:hypothetical protein Vadar_019355 [Vaccinium darrowii]|uniref:Uncharacterized protein n=1 Tax=Vaccinium darrowii TaxID=229202 RepID=A0ACB7X2J8_9ERIC|nr:hypothetical protein Vadar_019355 [Vaccinium darrowii]